MDLTPGMTALLPWWGTIQAAVGQSVGTAELWSAVREAAQAEGFTLRGAGATDMSRLRGLAASQRNAMREFARAGDNAAITGEMLAQDISSRDLAAQATLNQYVVRFQANLVSGGELSTHWVTSVFTGILPPTKGALVDQLSRDAERATQDPQSTTVPGDGEFVGLGTVSILAV